MMDYPSNRLAGPPQSYALNWNSLHNSLGMQAPQQGYRPANLRDPPRDPSSAYDQYIAPLDSVGSRYDGMMDSFLRLWR